MYVVDQTQHPLLVRIDPPSLNKITHTDLLRFTSLVFYNCYKHTTTLLHIIA